MRYFNNHCHSIENLNFTFHNLKRFLINLLMFTLVFISFLHPLLIYFLFKILTLLCYLFLFYVLLP